MQTTSPSKDYFNTLRTVFAVVLIIVLARIIHHHFPARFCISFLRLANLQRYANKFKVPAKKMLGGNLFQASVSIPNLVHFVHLVRPGPGVKFELLFPHFIAIYSAYYHLQPDIIYIHTNVEEDRLERILNHTTNPYTIAIRNLPRVQFKYHDVRNETSKGTPIVKLAHQSDFVRLDILKEYGGIYLDEDAYVLRDLRPLRNTGFENIIGKQKDGDICNAVIMATPNNKMLTAYRTVSDTVFDGSWTRHSAELLTVLAREFAAIEYQVLVVPQDVLFPLSWFESDLQILYRIHEQSARDAVQDVDAPDITTLTRRALGTEDPVGWELDWRSTYVLHGWHSALVLKIGSQTQIAETFGEFGGITLEYVLARNSNFARAVYPAVKHALDAGIIDDLGSDHIVG
ncbi:MAG: hypothetical protein Q9208_002315 [Pyrenodesmia sp. 3 TL-2023]